MMTSKKNGFWNFILAFIPGCSEMYMGFMKMGLSLMVAFWGIVVFSAISNMGPIVLCALIAWFYSFFHARNLYHLDDETFRAQEDTYLYNIEELTASGQKITEKYRKIIAIVLIFVGTLLVLKGIYAVIVAYVPAIISEIIRDIAYYLPRVIVGIAIIALGKHMIDGKKKELYDDTVIEDIVIEKGEENGYKD